MNENVILMLIALVIAIFNFWVALLNLPFDKKLAKFFVAANFALGVLNLATAVKYLMK